MTAIVRIALARPYTFVVMAILILIGGLLAALRTPTDVFPEIDIPVVAVAWQYANLSPSDMSGRILVPYQRALTTTVNDIEHIEATSLTGIGIVKVYFQPHADIRLANAQITAVSQTLLRQLPTGTTPPLILDYNASTVPILQLALSGQGLTEQQPVRLCAEFRADPAGDGARRRAAVSVRRAGAPDPAGSGPEGAAGQERVRGRGGRRAVSADPE